MLAKSLQKVSHQAVTLFCSGVSDSSQIQEKEFQREKELLGEQDTNLPLFYFSTVSIFNPSKNTDPYILHKREMEHFIRTKFPKYLIVRLPNMVGQGGNPGNLFPYFLQSISNNAKVTIRKNAGRYILGADDLSIIISLFIELELSGEINVCFPQQTPVLEMYQWMCHLMHKTPNFVVGGEETNSKLDDLYFTKLVQHHRLPIETDWKKIVEKFTLQFMQRTELG